MSMGNDIYERVGGLPHVTVEQVLKLRSAAIELEGSNGKLFSDNIALREELAALRAENDLHHEAFCEISNACIGALTMDYPLDPENTGHAIYVATGLANPELNEYVAQIEAGL